MVQTRPPHGDRSFFLERIPRRHMSSEELSVLWKERVRLLATVCWMRISCVVSHCTMVDLGCLLRQYPSRLSLYLDWWCPSLWHPLNLMPLHGLGMQGESVVVASHAVACSLEQYKMLRWLLVEV